VELFKTQSYNPVSHVVINTGTAAIVFRSEEVWKTIVVADLLNQVEFCNSRIALLSAMYLDTNIFKFVSEYYRVIRQQAINAVHVIGGGIAVRYCIVCKAEGRHVQATYKVDDGLTDVYVCGHHKDVDDAINIERVW